MKKTTSQESAETADKAAKEPTKKTTKRTKKEAPKIDTLTDEVRQLLIDVDTTHRYSMSRIYGLYNRAFGKEETPQSCASCLLRKVRELRRWLSDTEAQEAQTK